MNINAESRHVQIKKEAQDAPTPRRSRSTNSDIPSILHFLARTGKQPPTPMTSALSTFLALAALIALVDATNPLAPASHCSASNPQCCWKFELCGNVVRKTPHIVRCGPLKRCAKTCKRVCRWLLRRECWKRLTVKEVCFKNHPIFENKCVMIPKRVHECDLFKVREQKDKCRKVCKTEPHCHPDAKCKYYDKYYHPLLCPELKCSDGEDPPPRPEVFVSSHRTFKRRTRLRPLDKPKEIEEA